MHELAVTQSVIDAVCERMGDKPVCRVQLEIGRLSGVVADSVRFCFDLATEGTTLAGAALEIVEPSGQARCRDCSTEFTINDLLGMCRCGGWDLELLTGQQLTIREVEVAG